VNVLADQPSLFSDLETLPTHVVIYDFHPETNIFVVLAQAPTSLPTAKTRPAFFCHKPGRNPQIEAITLARYLGEKERASGPVMMV
jgi:hypothetical protein